MNYVMAMGGLGNQLFQYTFMKYLEKQLGLECSLHLDYFDAATDDQMVTNRGYELDKYNCFPKTVRGRLMVDRVINEKEFDVNDDYSRDNCYFRGYWQDKYYFQCICDELTKDLRLKDGFVSLTTMKTANEILSVENSVAVHVRRGDYLNSYNKNLFETISYRYYEEAIENIMDFYGDDLKIYIFSDDYEYVSDNMLNLCGYSCNIIPPGKSYEDLFLMQQAKHHVIANSTYSWWGAALSPNESEGMVIYPKKWYKNFQAPNLFFNTWIGI